MKRGLLSKIKSWRLEMIESNFTVAKRFLDKKGCLDGIIYGESLEQAAHSISEKCVYDIDNSILIIFKGFKIKTVYKVWEL